VAGATRIIATDRRPHRLEAAKAYGATITLNADDPDLDEAVQAATAGRGVDVAFEATDTSAAVETAVQAAKRGARIVLIGIPSDDRTTFSASIARRKGLTFKVVRRMKHVYPRAISLVDNGLVDVRSMVTHCFPLAEYEAAFAVAERREGLKVVIEPAAR
jgi:L-iditol 2-dehydrogenase